MKKGYNGYLILPSSRSFMIQNYLPKYNKVIAHHITHQFGVYEELPPKVDIGRVIGYQDSGDGLELFVVELDGKLKRPDGKTYHITYSLDPMKYKPKDSNKILEKMGFINIKSFLINLEPKFFTMN